MSEENVVQAGKFFESLRRNNKQIREDRATAIAEMAELKYKRQIEDLQVLLKDKRRTQENMLDMSPDNAMSLKMAENFDADTYVGEDIKIGIEIRNLEIKLEIARNRYEYLFGGEV
jgi:hypothetical protein